MSFMCRVLLPSLLAGLMTGMAGCTTPNTRAPAPQPAPVAKTSSTPANPSAWVGRWHGAHGASLDIRSQPSENGYALIFHRPSGVDVPHQAQATAGQLFYRAGPVQTALHPGTGATSPDIDQRALTYCLTTRPGNTTYCRRRDSADALALAHGAFVAVRRACEQAGPAETIVFDGQSLRHPGQARCTTRTLSQQGMIYSLQAGCIGPSASGPATANVVVTTPDTHHLALTARGRETRLYRYCATRSLPGPLQADMSAPHPPRSVERR